MFKYDSKTKKYKVLSFCDRLTDLSLSSPRVILSHPLRKRLEQTSEFDESCGRFIYKGKYKIVDRVKEMSVYRVSDFCLDNMLAVGSNLKPSPTLVADKFSSIGNAMTQATKIVDSVSNND